MGVTAVFILSSLGFAIIAQAQQCSKPAAGDNMNLKDEYITRETFADGSKVYFACNPGYVAAGGSAAITCTAGTWSTIQLRCERKSCGTLGEVSNGEVNYAGNEFGDTATVTCNQGYMLVGKSSFRCEVNGWSGRLPTCDAVQCTPPAPIANGAFAPYKDFYFFGETVRFSCIKGLVLSGSIDMTCSNDGKFSPSPPTCVKVECKDPVIKNAVFVSGSRPPHGFKATVTYSCESGYNMEGPTTVTCEINNQWSPSLPECKMGPPRPPPVPTAVTTVHTTTTKKPKGRTSTKAPTSNSPDDVGDHSSTWIIIVVVLICVIGISIGVFFTVKKCKRHCPVGPKLLHVKMQPDGEDYPRTTLNQYGSKEKSETH